MGLNEKFFKTSAVDDTPNFAPTIWTGNDTARNISTGFAPDFVWIKSRTAARNHYLYDSIRGVNNQLLTNATSAQANIGERLTAFNSDSFRIGTSAEVNNASTEKYVGWAWKGGGSSVQNNDGSINGANCLVSANVAAGFSIIKWRGNGTNSATIGHGLDSAPELIIHKGLTNPTSWVIGIGGISGFSASDYLQFNTAAKSNSSTFFQGYGSSTFTVGVSSANEMNKNSSNYYIGYAFHSVDGYSKIGSYVGGGTTDVPITLGFTPAFVMIKSSTYSPSGWIMYDNKRQTGTGAYENYTVLFAETAQVESTDNVVRGIQFNSNGFIANQNYEHTNDSGDTYIYLAIA